MPTATATLSWTITNWGPLITPWSLPPTCTDRAFIYTTEGPWNSEYPIDAPLVGFYAQCDNNGRVACYPEPTDSNARSALSELRATPTIGGYHAGPIYSPAPECPEGWETVGALRRDGDAPVSRSGLYTVPYEAYPGFPQVGFKDALASLLDPSETAIMCCPR
ncbi:hypothetical protein BJX62DRAFT_203885 [Aspergillus germanicus]